MSHPLDYLPPELWEVIAGYLKPEELYNLSEACSFWLELFTQRHLLPIIWLPRANGIIPKFAVVGATNAKSKPKWLAKLFGGGSSKNVYIARASHDCDLPSLLWGTIPGRLHSGQKFAYVPYNGGEFAKAEYEVLVAPPETLTWVQTEGRNIPDHAVVAGNDPNGDPYHICKVSHEGIVTVGKVHQRYSRAYVAYDGKEHEYSRYEILVLTELGRTVKYIDP